MCSNECTDFRRSGFSPQKKTNVIFRAGAFSFQNELFCDNVVANTFSEEQLNRTTSLQLFVQGVRRNFLKGQVRCKIISGGATGKDNVGAKSFLEEFSKRTISSDFLRFLKTTMSLKDHVWRSNRNGQFRCKQLFKEIGGISEKDKFVAKSCLREPLTTSSWQSHFWRSSVKTNVVVELF